MSHLNLFIFIIKCIHSSIRWLKAWFNKREATQVSLLITRSPLAPAKHSGVDLYTVPSFDIWVLWNWLTGSGVLLTLRRPNRIWYNLILSHIRKDESQLSDKEYSELHIQDKTCRDKKGMNGWKQDECYWYACIIPTIQRLETSILVLKLKVWDSNWLSYETYLPF